MALTNQDFVKGKDLSAYNPLTAQDLNDAVDDATPKDDGGGEGKGLIIRTKDTGLGVPAVPDASITVKWRRYIWLRVPYDDSQPKIYAWNDTLAVPDATYLKWFELLTDTTAINTAIALANAAQTDADTADAKAQSALDLATSNQGRITVAEGAIISNYYELLGKDPKVFIYDVTLTDANAGIVEVPHGLPYIPHQIIVNLYCTSGASPGGYDTADFIPIEHLGYDPATPATDKKIFPITVNFNETNIRVTYSTAIFGTVYIPRKDATGYTVANLADWALRIRAIVFPTGL